MIGCKEKEKKVFIYYEVSFLRRGIENTNPIIPAINIRYHPYAGPASSVQNPSIESEVPGNDTMKYIAATIANMNVSIPIVKASHLIVFAFPNLKNNPKVPINANIANTNATILI